MPNIIDQALDTLYERAMEMPNKVLDIFNNFFGEERVDMQGFPSEEELRLATLRMFVEKIFQDADMKNRLPPEELNRRLADIDFESLPAESATAISKAIMSSSFVEYCKSIWNNGFILVHFPQVTVTNEHNRSTVVKHIYIKVPITVSGSENGLFTMNRSEYTIEELFSNYMHSHASNIPKSNFKHFVSCCLGTGPLLYTQSNLSTGFDEDRWNLFCLELSKYVEVESIAGRPYHYLEKIGVYSHKVSNVGGIYLLHDAYPTLGRRNREAVIKALKEFLLYYLDHNNLTFSYRNGVYSIGMSFIEYLIHLSNSFIDWVNSKPELAEYKNGFGPSIICRYNIINDALYVMDSIDADVAGYRQYIGQEVCLFKGKFVTITISNLSSLEDSLDTGAMLINPTLASAFLNRILRTINYRYGRNQENSNSPSSKIKYKI